MTGGGASPSPPGIRLCFDFGRANGSIGASTILIRGILIDI